MSGGPEKGDSPAPETRTREPGCRPAEARRPRDRHPGQHDPDPGDDLALDRDGRILDASRAATPRVRVLIADDHLALRKGLAALLGDLDDIEVVGVAENGREALRAAARLLPDVVLMDVAMPEMDGVEATRAITRTLPEVRVLGLSMHRERGTERKMLAAGALGYVVKDAPVEELVTAIRRAGMSSRSSAVGETTDAKPPDDDAS